MTGVSRSALIAFLDAEFPTYPTPSAISIWRKGRDAFEAGDLKRAEMFVAMNRMVNNSEIPATVRIGKGTKFAYGGVGVIVHKDAVIGKRCSIGSQVTISGLCSEIGDDVYLATGSKLVGPCRIGSASIVGANSVVTTDVESLSVVAGSPAKKISRITLDALRKYQAYFNYKGSRELEKEFADRYRDLMYRDAVQIDLPA